MKDLKRSISCAKSQKRGTIFFLNDIMRRRTLNGPLHASVKSLEADLVSMDREHEGLQDGVLFCEK